MHGQGHPQDCTNSLRTATQKPCCIKSVEKIMRARFTQCLRVWCLDVHVMILGLRPIQQTASVMHLHEHRTLFALSSPRGIRFGQQAMALEHTLNRTWKLSNALCMHSYLWACVTFRESWVPMPFEHRFVHKLSSQTFKNSPSRYSSSNWVHSHK